MQAAGDVRRAALQQQADQNNFARQNYRDQQQAGYAQGQQQYAAQIQEARDQRMAGIDSQAAQQHADLQAQLSQTELGQQEQMRLQRLRQARGSVMANPDLSDEERNALITQIETGLNPLENRQRQSQMMWCRCRAALAISRKSSELCTYSGPRSTSQRTWNARTTLLPRPSGRERTSSRTERQASLGHKTARSTETVLASCLAVFELRQNNVTEGPQQRLFMERLAASIAYDRKLKPLQLGYNGDRSDGISMPERLATWNGTVTYEGVQY